MRVGDWTNEEAIRRWGQLPREVLDDMEPEGDFGRRHLLNPLLLRMPGDVRGQLCAGGLVSVAQIGGPFDVVIANMVFLDILDWTSAMREHGEYRIREYFAEYEIPQP
jgi:hypothetical protein